MDHTNFNTEEIIRKPGKHLTSDERGKIEVMRKLGYSCRAIAKEIHCSHSTVYYELKRNTPLRNGSRGRAPKYLAKRAHKRYLENRKNCHKQPKIYASNSESFIQWLTDKVRTKTFSIDTAIGYAKRYKLFPEDSIPCTKTIYNMLHKKLLPLSLFDCPKILRRRKHKLKKRQHKRILGHSIDERPAIAAEKTEFGHWEVDTVVGKRKGKEAVLFTAVEKKTGYGIVILIPGRNSDSVELAMNRIAEHFDAKFSDVFKTITSDNGPEFATLSKYEDTHHTKIYFAHPYCSCERPQNERYNGFIREYIPKGISMETYNDEDIFYIADKINARPRKRLNYYSPEELFEAELDTIYAM